MCASARPYLKRTIYTGTFLSAPSLGKLDIVEDAAVGVDENGIIVFILKEVAGAFPVEIREGREVEWERDLREKVRKLGWGTQSGADSGESEDQGWEWVKGRRDGMGWYFPGFVGMWISNLIL